MQKKGGGFFYEGGNISIEGDFSVGGKGYYHIKAEGLIYANAKIARSMKG